nr:ORF2 [Tick-associated anellovirus 2]
MGELIPGSPEDLLRRVQEDRFLLICVAAHGMFCECDDFKRHIPGWRGDIEEEGGHAGGEGAPSTAAGGGSGGGGAGGASPTDAELVAVDFDVRVEDSGDETG